MKQVTVTTMIYTDGQKAVYGVYRGKLGQLRGEPYVTLGEMVGNFTFIGKPLVSHLHMAKRHETPEWPAYDFGRA